jgi:alpha-1,2-mannosyltransferase
MFTAGFWVLGASLWMDIDYMGATLQRISSQSMIFHVDFDSFWRSARAMLEGQSIYDTGVDLVNLNPPLWTVLISPLGLLEPITAYRVFFLFSLLIVVGYLAWTVEELHLRPGWTVVGVVMLLLWLPGWRTGETGRRSPGRLLAWSLP